MDKTAYSSALAIKSKEFTKRVYCCVVIGSVVEGCLAYFVSYAKYIDGYKYFSCNFFYKCAVLISLIDQGKFSCDDSVYL